LKQSLQRWQAMHMFAHIFSLAIGDEFDRFLIVSLRKSSIFKMAKAKNTPARVIKIGKQFKYNSRHDQA
jgi:hypothetical protein